MGSRGWLRASVVVAMWLALAGPLASCAAPALVACEELLCPEGMACGPAGGCYDPAQVAACDGLAAGSPCQWGGVDEATCRGGVCVPVGCGNGVLDGEVGERCDDGNTINGDGCSADCRSQEVCGNGVLDAAASEQCDDGNLFDGDGCQANCLLPFCGDGVIDVTQGEVCDDGNANSDEPSAVSLLQGAARSPGDGTLCRTTCTLQRCGDEVTDAFERCDDGNQQNGDGCSFDCQSREECGDGYTDYALGEACDAGTSHSLSGDGCTQTCQREIPVWEELHPSPPNRNYSAMVYSPARQEAVLFGGVVDGRMVNDTWIYDSATRQWSPQLLAVSPPARSHHALVYHPGRDSVILVGGTLDAGWAADMWEFTLADRQWHPLAVSGPVPAGGWGAAYAPANDTIIATANATARRFSFAEMAWTELATSAPYRFNHRLIWHPGRNAVVLVAGRGGDGMAWAYDPLGDVWAPLGEVMPALWHGCPYFDEARNQLIVVGGWTWGFVNALAYAYDEATGQWTALPTTGAAPPGRHAPACTYDASRAEGLSFGSSGYPFFSAETDGKELVALPSQSLAWQVVEPVRPPKTPYGVMAYDRHRGQVVMMVTYYGRFELWLLNTRTMRWSQRAIPPEVGVRWNANWVYDERAEVFVMFGGSSTYIGGEHWRDTWHYNATTDSWRQIATATAPLGRHIFGMAYDAKAQRVIMYGGRYPNGTGGLNYLRDTWLYDTATETWTEVLGDGPVPTGSVQGLMAYNGASGAVELSGGWPYSGEQWRFDIATGRWELIQFDETPPWQFLATVAYDAARGARLISLGLGPHNLGVSQTISLNMHAGTWQEQVTNQVPPTRWAQGSVYEPITGRTLMYGGFNGDCSIPGVTDDCGDLWAFGYQDALDARARELCLAADVDTDGDGYAGCADDDCWALCDPMCAPAHANVMTPACADSSRARCGDGVCNSALETPALCPSDCP